MTTFSASNQKTEKDGKTDEMKAGQRPYESSEIAGAVNLMVHPFAGAAALSALGMGVAGHAFGVWMGFVSGVADASRRLFVSEDIDPGLFGPAPIYGKRPESAGEPVAVPSDKPAHTATVTPISAARARAPGGTAQKAKNWSRVEVAPEPVVMTAAPASDAATTLMPEDFRRPKAAGRPATPDDLKLISGVGPKLEKVLNGLGAWTFAQIAAWEPAETAWVDDYLSFSGRIARDGWIGQAAALARKARKP